MNTESKKQLVFDTYRKTKSKRETSKLTGVPRSTVHDWIKSMGAVELSSPDADDLRGVLRHGAFTLDELAVKFSKSKGEMLDMCESLRSSGVNICLFGDRYTIHSVPEPTPQGIHTYLSRPGGYYKFGYVSDSHLCSKYAREDVLDDLYSWFEENGVDRVFHTGNYIDGETHFNKHDIFVHGMQNQLNYFCERYPYRNNITTYIVSGDDHEGWYGQREGVDIGWLMEQTAKKYGRDDLVNLGFMEAFITLQHADIPESVSQLLAVHPGGGSAYATSYAPQKYVEALSGGEKPAIILFGHWHKIFDLLIRNVICLGGGCTKDLDPFGRKNKLAYHLGGMIVELWQDPSGAITRWRVEKKQYFDRGYYNDQWNYTGRDSIQTDARRASWPNQQT